MKKFLLCFLLLLLPILLLGCSKSVTLEDSISEITKIYFTANTVGAKGNISVGQREENYKIDGNHTKNCDFSLISIKFDELLPNNQIIVDISINETISQVELDLNPANHYYMADLGFLLKADDKVKISYNDFVFDFENASEKFVIDYQEALSLAKEELKDKLKGYYDGKQFNGEGYLKILTEQGGDDENLFWVFTIVGKNGLKSNVVLSVDDGRVIVSD